MKAYKVLVDQVLQKLEQWVLPWSQSWSNSLPTNYVSNKPYRGLNKLLLSFNDFEDHRYLTYKQIEKLWGKLKSGEKWSKVYYYNKSEVQNDKTWKTEFMYFIRYYTVYNIQQVKNVEFDSIVENTNDKISTAEEVLMNYKDSPKVMYGNRASYNSQLDTISIPDSSKFTDISEYYVTLFHELIHSTWHKCRLSRFKQGSIEYFDRTKYSKEELVAELGAMFLCMEVWIHREIFDNSVGYISGWFDYIKNNKQDLLQASVEAEKAVDYILGRSNQATLEKAS